MPGTDVAAWWWTTILLREGHRFERGEWRCADCRRDVIELLEFHAKCESPWADKHLFIGGPLDGQWRHTGGHKLWAVRLPNAPPTDVDVDPDPGFVYYALSRRAAKGDHVYVFMG